MVMSLAAILSYLQNFYSGLVLYSFCESSNLLQTIPVKTTTLFFLETGVRVRSIRRVTKAREPSCHDECLMSYYLERQLIQLPSREYLRL